MVLRLRGSDAGSATANDAATFYRLASDGNTDAVEVMHLQSYRSSLVRYVSLMRPLLPGSAQPGRVSGIGCLSQVG